MRKMLLGLVVLILAHASFADTGTVSQVEYSLGNPNKIVLTCTSGANGAVDQDLTGYIRGEIKRVVFEPTSGDTAPSNNYDVTLSDENGIDIFSGLGSNLSSTVAYSIVPGESITDGTTTSVVPFVVNGVLSLVCTNMGASNITGITFYLQK